MRHGTGRAPRTGHDRGLRDIWWVANPDAPRQPAAALLATAIVALVVVGSEQLWRGWRRGPAWARGARPAPLQGPAVL